MRDGKTSTKEAQRSEKSYQSVVEMQTNPEQGLSDIVICLEQKVLSMDKELSDVKHLVLKLKAALSLKYPNAKSSMISAPNVNVEDLSEDELRHVIFRPGYAQDHYLGEDNGTPLVEALSKRRVPHYDEERLDIGHRKTCVVQCLADATLGLLAKDGDAYSDNDDFENGTVLLQLSNGDEEIEDASSELTSTDTDDDDVQFLPFRRQIHLNFLTHTVGQAAINKQMGKCPGYWKYGGLNRPLKTLSTPVTVPPARVIQEPAATPQAASRLMHLKSI